MFALRGGRVLTADGGLRPATVIVEDTMIAAIEPASGNGVASDVVDATGLLVLPGIVDLHGDAFERQIMPRPGVRFPLDVALVDTDRQMLANGITTAFHGITYSWEPGLRGRDMAVEMFSVLERLRPRLVCDTHIHLRFEVFNIDAVDEVAQWLAAGRVALLAFNDHMAWFLTHTEDAEKLAVYVGRSGLAPDAFLALLHATAARRHEVPAVVTRLAEAAGARDVAILSHDDETPEMRRWYHDLGSRLCEFPVDEPTARTGRDLGDDVILGAPNVLRGGSHCNRLSASAAVADGLCTVLTSDYYYPALLHAPFRLAADGVVDLESAWALVTDNPARAAGLHDRGVIAPGRRADLVLVDDSDPRLPHVAATWVGGCPAHVAGPPNGGGNGGRGR